MTNLTDKQIKALPAWKQRQLEAKRDLKAVRVLAMGGFTVDYGIRKFKQAHKGEHWLIDQFKQNAWNGEATK